MGNFIDKTGLAYIKSKIAEMIAARVIKWSEITGKPSTFTPSTHSHSVATTSADGYMSSSDKTKLNSVQANANNYTLPTAGLSLGGVKTNSTVTSSSGYTACPIIAGIPYYKDTANKLTTPRTINGTSFDGSANIITANWGTARTIKVGSASKSVNGSVNISYTHNEIQVTKAIQNTSFGGSNVAMTTAEFITLLNSLGAFSQGMWVSRGSWSYAANKYISDTGFGNIHLAGSVVMVFGTSSAYTIIIYQPTTTGVSSGTVSGDFIYVNNGTSYRPGWRKLYSSAQKPTLADLGVTATAIELNQLDGVLYNVQEVLNNAMFVISKENGIVTLGNLADWISAGKPKS